MRLVRTALASSSIVDLPGTAEAKRAGGDGSELVRELGDNYGRHHKYLRDALRQRGRPQPGNFKTFEAFLEAWSEVEAIVETEALLRRCEAARKRGRRLDAPIDLNVPLVDSNDGLVSLDGYRID